MYVSVVSLSSHGLISAVITFVSIQTTGSASFRLCHLLYAMLQSFRVLLNVIHPYFCCHFASVSIT